MEVRLRVVLRLISLGSVKGDNSVDLMKKPDVDGFLVGGASLKAKEFITILNSPKGAGRL